MSHRPGLIDPDEASALAILSLVGALGISVAMWWGIFRLVAWLL